MAALAGFAEVSESHPTSGTTVAVNGLDGAGAGRVRALHQCSLLPVETLPIVGTKSMRGAMRQFHGSEATWRCSESNSQGQPSLAPALERHFPVGGREEDDRPDQEDDRDGAGDNAGNGERTALLLRATPCTLTIELPEGQGAEDHSADAERLHAQDPDEAEHE